ncbi:DUF1302 family protein [Pseudomonas aeruginosa]|uniref:DUF1302 family protein n=1 Tax=Pseudomonas aeruginosa TaxID=287 RepID=UPI0040350DD1
MIIIDRSRLLPLGRSSNRSMPCVRSHPMKDVTERLEGEAPTRRVFQQQLFMTLAVSTVLCSVQAAPQGPEALGSKLTPLGGEIAASASGDIPAWTQPGQQDEGWSYGQVRGEHWKFKGDKPLYSICWKDEKKFQWHLTGLYSFTPSNSPTFLDFSGASTGSLLTELVVIKYPGLHDEVNGEPLAAGLNAWQLDPARAPKSRGDKTSSGINLDFSLTYDGTLLPGWQVTPGVFYARSLGGRTPNLSATFTEDASSMNLYLNFVRNPASWQISLNYAKFMGGETPYDQLYRDRDYVGIAISRTL